MDTNASARDEVNVEALMARIKEEVKAGVGAASRRFPSQSSSPRQQRGVDSSPVLYAEELNYLNAHWRPWNVRAELSTHRGLLGRLALRFKEYLLHLVWDIFFAEYFRREEEYQRQLVRYQNKVARYIDARDAELFWQLVDKLDSDIGMINSKSDRLYDELAVSIDRLEARLDELQEDRSE